MLAAWKITASWRSCCTENYLRASAPKEPRKSASKTHWKSPWNPLVSPLIARKIWRRTEASVVKLSDVEKKSVKAEETQQMSHHSLFSLPKTFPCTSWSHLAICALTDAFFIDYDGKRSPPRAFLKFCALAFGGFLLILSRFSLTAIDSHRILHIVLGLAGMHAYLLRCEWLLSFHIRQSVWVFYMFPEECLFLTVTQHWLLILLLMNHIVKLWFSYFCVNSSEYFLKRLFE